jgi:hypothetical protein
MNRMGLTLGVLAGLLCMALARSPAPDDTNAAKAELLALHQADRRAHFQHDIDALLGRHPADFVYVRDGKVELQATNDSMRKTLTEYFRRAEFTAWDDLQPPIVHVSPDGQMGWMIVRLRLAYTDTDSAGKKKQGQSVIAWMDAYEKRGGKWFNVANASTFEPGIGK